MITFNKPQGARVLELGGGGNRHPLSDVNVDVRAEPGVDFTVDFNKPEWPELSSNEFDIILSIFCLEHVSWRCIPNFLKQTLRVLKPGGNAIFVVPNTQAQMKYILSKPEFDGDEGSMLFGTLDYPENSHRAAFSPSYATKLFNDAGFVNITTTPFGEPLKTDMIIEANKPFDTPPPPPPPAQEEPLPQPVIVSAPQEIKVAQPRRPAVEVFNRDYFEHYCGQSFYWDYPTHEIIARKLLDLKPESVLELGCARGYVLKRLQDAGISGQGVDVSRHAWMTRVCDPINLHDLTQTPWPLGKKEFDLAYSISLLEYIPEDILPAFMDELTRVSKRGLHAVTLEGLAPSPDPNRTTLRPMQFWQKLMPEGHEIVDVRDMTAGDLPPEYMKGNPGRLNLNIGCAWTMAPGYLNVDIVDAENFARVFGYTFLRHDVRQGIPYGTQTVDRIFSSHFLEHLTYDEGIRFLRECRRVIRPDGAMRLVVPNTEELTAAYHNLPGVNEYNEMNEGCGKAPTAAGKLWALLAEGHKAFLDTETLEFMLKEAGWDYHPASFRHTAIPQVQEILASTVEMTYNGSSLFCDATPKLG